MSSLRNNLTSAYTLIWSFLSWVYFSFMDLYLASNYFARRSSSTRSVTVVKDGIEVSFRSCSSSVRFCCRIFSIYYLFNSRVLILVYSLLISASLYLFLYFYIYNSLVFVLSWSYRFDVFCFPAELFYRSLSSWSAFLYFSFVSCSTRCFCLFRFWISYSAINCLFL